jgi:molybdopterin converting factor small subunit
MKIQIEISGFLKIKNVQKNAIIDLQDKATIRDLLTHLNIEKDRQGAIVFLINDEPAWKSTVLKDNDHVKLYVPVSGG